jgi:RNA-directed DNA polymerase
VVASFDNVRHDRLLEKVAQRMDDADIMHLLKIMLKASGKKGVRLVVLIDAYKRHDWLIGAVTKRLREEFAKLQVEINDEKSRIVDLAVC